MVPLGPAEVTPMRDRTPFRLDAAALALGHASNALALDGRAIGQMMSLAAELPETVYVMAADATSGKGGSAGLVAVLDIRGPLAQRAEEFACGSIEGYDSISDRFALAISDPAVSAVVLRIDSPGGDAAGCFEAVKHMQAVRAASAKPVLAYCDELCASAAYALATVANAGIFLPAGGVAGSVGVLSMHMSVAKAMEYEGAEVTIARSGKRKAELNPYEPLTEEARAAMQSHVDTLAGQFAALVGTARGMKPKAVLALEGAVFMGKEAVEAGLADDVLSFEAVLALAEKEGRKAAKERSKMKANVKLGLAADAGENETVAAIEDLQAVLEATGKTDAAEALGQIDAWKSNTESLAIVQAELLEARVQIANQAGKADAIEMVAMIDAAASDRKVVPANRAKVEAFGAKYGKAALAAHLDALVAVAPAAEAVAAEPAHEATGAAPTASFNAKPFSQMAPVERANFIQTHGRAAYEAHKAAYN